MNMTTSHSIHHAGSEPAGTTGVHKFDQPLHRLTTALCSLVCVVPFVAWTVPVRQALVAMGL